MEETAGSGSPHGAAPPEATPKEFVTICAECKKVIRLPGRPGQTRSGMQDEDSLVSHGICEECARRLYGPIFNRRG
jgi:hypothetical protein